MYGYFVFEAGRPGTPHPILGVFCATASPSANEVISVIAHHKKSSYSFSAILLVGLESERESIGQISSDPSIVDCLPVPSNAPATKLVEVLLIPRQGLDQNTEVLDSTWRDIQNAALLTIFDRRNTLLVSPPTHHFAKPSKRHSNKFIRTANALVDGAEITFIAACCLQYVNDSVRHFYCDTGGIAVVAFAIDSLRRRFAPGMINASVNTFESYGGLKKFDFRSCDTASVLLSASTSGGLERDILNQEPRLRPTQIITLFSLGDRKTESHIVLDLEISKQHRESLGEFRSYPEDDCLLCKEGSIHVPMMGDQFIPSQSVTDTVLIKQTHAPVWLSRFLSATACNGVLRAFYPNPDSSQSASLVFIDMEQLFEGIVKAVSLQKRIDRMISQATPVATTRILYLGDPSSAKLAAQIQSRLKELRHEASNLEIRPIREALNGLSESDGATIVVAGAIASGQSLLSASQLLRNLETSGAITYLVGLSRMSTVSEYEKLERDLRMGEVSSDYGFCVAERINLPLNGRFSVTSWDEELELLQALSDATHGSLRTCFEERIRFLQEAASRDHRGLADRLFWPASNSVELQLRPGFVFFPKDVDPQKASQGDVFFAVVAVLHHLRVGSGAKSLLRQTEYKRVLISPLCFDRFNDGILQAALLRAANRPELDYSSSPEESEAMCNVLRAILEGADTTKGEAAREFLLAIAIDRLVLCGIDIADLYNEFASVCTDPVSSALWAEIKKRHLY